MDESSLEWVKTGNVCSGIRWRTTNGGRFRITGSDGRYAVWDTRNRGPGMVGSWEKVTAWAEYRSRGLDDADMRKTLGGVAEGH